jgi:CRP-like cAMP-binding protein
MIREGERLRSTEPFGSLTPPEAAVLRSFMERFDAEEGSTIVRQGEVGDALYLIETGHADVRVDDHTIAALGPGQHFGEISLLTGGERIADVVAATDMALLRLGRDDFERYLAHLVGVEESMARTASQRAEETARARNSG